MGLGFLSSLCAAGESGFIDPRHKSLRRSSAIPFPAFSFPRCVCVCVCVERFQHACGLSLPSISIRTIRGHRPKSSLGDKILAIREGDYKNCFREGEGKHFLGYGKDMGRKFSFSYFFTKILKRARFFTFFLMFFQKSTKCLMFLLHQGGGSPGNFSFSTIGGVKNCLREGDCVLEGQPMGIPPPSPSPCPPMVKGNGGGREAEGSAFPSVVLFRLSFPKAASASWGLTNPEGGEAIRCTAPPPLSPVTCSNFAQRTGKKWG